MTNPNFYNMNFTGIIVEDDRQQQESLKNLLAEHFPELSILGVASSIPEARALLGRVKPDLAFMDVMLPPETSFDLISSLDRISFEIIFTTSFEEFAVRAFRLSAVDYLVKPIATADLVGAINAFKRRKQNEETPLHLQNLLDNLQLAKSDSAKIALPTLTGYLFIKVRDIIRCESDNTYTTFFTTSKQKIVVSKTLKDCEQMLADFRFFRVHNSHLINLEYINEYIKGEGGIVKMSDGSQIDVSRRRKEEFLAVLRKN